MEGGVDILPMSSADLSQIIEIERLSFPNPWPEQLFIEELSNALSSILLAKNRTNEQILGFVCFWMVEDESHILNLAVHPRHLRKGIGRSLLLSAISSCREKGAVKIFLEVRSTNKGAIEFYKGLGFKAYGMRKGYYEETLDDAILMALTLDNNDRQIFQMDGQE